MNPAKIFRIAALAVAVIAAVVTIPYVALLFIVLGLGIGILGVSEDRRLLYLVGAVALAQVANALGPVPAIGTYLTDFITNMSTIINAGAVAVLAMIFKDRITE
ncbi:MAG TPA: hypothetical protein VI566_07730 [Xanthomonadales bacterium]|nr:hypothetical protein [Xanthomonadales bacterium]